MNHHTSTKPFYLLTGVPNPTGMMYGVNEVGKEIAATIEYTFEEFDTEAELAAKVDALIGVEGWYYLPENRIPYPYREVQQI